MNRCKKLEKELYLATCSACCFFLRVNIQTARKITGFAAGSLNREGKTRMIGAASLFEGKANESL